jgi:ATP-dependent helicase HrpA
MDKQQASDEKHRRFHDKESDFLAFVNLWNYLGEQQKALSSNQFRRQCRVDFLNCACANGRISTHSCARW